MVCLLRDGKQGGDTMINTSKLRGLIAERGLSQRQIAKDLGITEKTFYNKMKNGVFSSAEISAMLKLLRPDDPMSIFFADCVS